MAVDRSLDKEYNKKGTISLLLQIIEVLNKFSSNFEKRLNFEKLAYHLKLTSSEADDFLSLIISFQDLFNNILKGYTIQKKIVNNQLYLIPEKNHNLSHIPKKIIMSETHLNLLNDIIYLFKFVKKGSGFDVATNGKDSCIILKNYMSFTLFFFNTTMGCYILLNLD